MILHYGGQKHGFQPQSYWGSGFLLLFEGDGEVYVPGPFRSVAAQTWNGGTVQSQEHKSGSITGQSWNPGSIQSEAV